MFITISNPIFVREGIDILYQNDYITITKQALVYGVFVSFIIVCVLLLYQIMQVYLTSEHILYIFNRHFAVLGLLLMIVFRMLPKCKRKIKEIQDVQNTLHRKRKGLWYMLRSLKDQFLVLFTWIFESSLILYESMKARGYQNKRTHFHVFYWQMTDTFYVSVILLLNIGLYMGYLRYHNFYYYPKMAPITFQRIDILIYIVLFVYCLLPLCWKGDQHDYY
jgi:energy-coupling factor transport system permease protein